MKTCPNCGGKVKSGNVFCSKTCSEVNKHKRKEQEVVELKKEIVALKRRIKEQDNLWENLIGDVEASGVSPSHIRWWKTKLVKKHNFDNENRMLGWLSDVATVLETYDEARNSQ